MAYNLLTGIRVIEVALLAPDALGGHLADLGADVIKVEPPSGGDRARTMGPVAVGSSTGPSFLHLNWNRGKRSVALDLKTPGGQATFLELAKESDVVIEGLRAGTLDRWGIGYDVLHKANPALVFCSLSGLGRAGPYRDLATHGAFFDAYAGFVPARDHGDGTIRPVLDCRPQAGFQASGLWAAMAVLAALLRSQRTGEGALVEVAEAEVSAFWRWREIEEDLNRDLVHRRRGYGDGEGIDDLVRYSYYRTSDQRIVFFMATEAKFWDNFLEAVGRTDLKQTYPSLFDYDHQFGAEGLRRELTQLFRTRTQQEWIELFIRYNVPGGPVNESSEILDDPHFMSRHNVYEVFQPGVGDLQLMATPIKVDGQQFSQDAAPELGQHSTEVLGGLVGHAPGPITGSVDGSRDT